MPTPLLHFHNLSLHRAGKLILKGIDWTVNAGEHWLITGNNGSGKSTLADAIAGKHRVVGGTREWPGLSEPRSSSIRMVSFTDTSNLFQNANAVHYYQQRFNAAEADGHLTVREYLLANGHSEASAVSTLSALGADHLMDTERIKLSSGQTRKLLLAKALAGQPEMLVIDNPYLGLDAASRSVLNTILSELVAENNIDLVLIGNATDVPACISHRLHLQAGTVAYAGEASAYRQAPVSGFVAETLHQDILPHFQTLPAIAAEPEEVLKLESVKVQYGENVVFDNLNWTVRQGEKWVVSGGNGNGKSTLLSLIYADHPQAYANHIYLFGYRRGRGESIWDIKRRIGFTSPELHSFFEGGLTAKDVVLSGLKDTFQPPAKPTTAQISLMEALWRFSGLPADYDKLFRQFSTGEQRLLLLLRALIKAPPVLLLDEPFQGLDPAAIQRCRQLLDAVLTPERTLIFISHFRSEVPEKVAFELKL